MGYLEQAKFQRTGRAASASSAAVTCDPSDAAGERAARILLIDDDVFLPAQIRQAPSVSRSEIASARTGAAGVDHVRRSSPDLVLLGLRLPDQSGFAVYEEKILRLLQEQVFQRVGGNETIRTDVRVRSSHFAPAARRRRRRLWTSMAFISDHLGPATNDLYDVTHREVDRLLLVRTLEHVNGSQRQAAQLLGISRQTMRLRLRTLALRVAHAVAAYDTVEIN